MKIVEFVVFTLVLLVLFLLRANGTRMGRPLEYDESLTVWNHTWVGVEPTGERNPPGRIEEFYALARPGVRHLIIGLYCAAGRWVEPNNHIINSCLVNFALAFGPRTESTARWPALIGAFLLCVCSYVLGRAFLRWEVAPLSIALIAWFLPYVDHYGQTSRGYTWMLALQVMSILAAYCISRRPNAVAPFAAALTTIVAINLNVVSMTVDWVVPLLAAMWLLRPAMLVTSGTAPRAEDRESYRKTVAAVALASAIATAVFACSHLPAIFAASRHYGIKFDDLPGFFRHASESLAYLFPTALLKILAAVSLLGLVAMLRDGASRFLGALGLLSLAISTAHYLASHTLPYPRTQGFYLLIFLIGLGYMIESAWRLLAPCLGGGPRFWSFGLCIATAGVIASTPADHQERGWDDVLSARRPEYRAWVDNDPYPTSYSYLITDKDVDELYGIYSGPGSEARTLPPDTRLCVLVLGSRDEHGGPRVLVYQGRRADASSQHDRDTDAYWSSARWCRRVRDFSRQAGVVGAMTGSTRAHAAGGPVPRGCLVFWYPDFQAVGLSVDGLGRILDFLDRRSIRYIREIGRMQAKLELFNYIKCLILIVESDRDAEEAADILREGLPKFGGRSMVFLPDGDPGTPSPPSRSLDQNPSP